MNGKDLLSGLGYIDQEFYKEAESENIIQMNPKKRTLKGTASKILIIAAVLSTMVITASAAGYSWFQRYFESRSAEPLSPTEAAFLAEMEQPIYESQTRDGYTLTVKSAISDGRVAYINIGITAPEGQLLSRTEIPGYDPGAPSIDPGNFGHGFFTLADGGRVSASMSLGTLEDYDGRDNTQDWILMVKPDQEEGQLPFGPGNVWKLHIEDLVATYEDEAYRRELSERLGAAAGTLMAVPEGDVDKLMPKVTLAEGTWDFEIELKACDTRTVEFVREPITTVCASGWLDDGTEVYKNVNVTSVSVGTFGAVILSDAEFAPDFTCISDNKYVQVVMKDGSQIRLRSSSASIGQQDLEAERPILLDNVDHVLLADGTKLPMP